MLGFVLLVDDDPSVLNLNEAVVRHFGFKAMAAETVGEALDIIKNVEISLIISDVEMPGESGFDFAHQLQEKNLKTMPLVYMTGYNNLDLLKIGLSVGGDDFILKGSPTSKMRERIAFWMASGFTGLPSELRQKSLSLLEKTDANQGASLEQILKFDPHLGSPVLEKLERELALISELHSFNYCDKISFLGRLSKLILKECELVGDYIRFPDYCYFISSKLDLPFFDSLRVIFRSFDDLTSDERFLLGAQNPLNTIK